MHDEISNSFVASATRQKGISSYSSATSSRHLVGGRRRRRRKIRCVHDGADSTGSAAAAAAGVPMAASQQQQSSSSEEARVPTCAVLWPPPSVSFKSEGKDRRSAWERIRQRIFLCPQL
ncbi:unnamed protein product [Sphagnum compactum]